MTTTQPYVSTSGRDYWQKVCTERLERITGRPEAFWRMMLFSCCSALNEPRPNGDRKKTEDWIAGLHKQDCGKPAVLLVLGRGMYPYCPRCFCYDGAVVAKSNLIVRLPGFTDEIWSEIRENHRMLLPDAHERWPHLESYISAIEASAVLYTDIRGKA